MGAGEVRNSGWLLVAYYQWSGEFIYRHDIYSTHIIYIHIIIYIYIHIIYIYTHHVCVYVYVYIYICTHILNAFSGLA